jgi:hypothetical protein
MGRRLLILGSVVSLLLCAAAVLVWLTNYWRSESEDYFLKVIAPVGAVVLMFVILPCVSHFRASHRAGNKGICPRCSYDLTGNTSGVCPECGTLIANP